MRQRSLSSLPFGLPSPPPLPKPLLPREPRPPDYAIAVEVREVDSSSVIAGGLRQQIFRMPQETLGGLHPDVFQQSSSFSLVFLTWYIWPN
jgi:hypothetical protein